MYEEEYIKQNLTMEKIGLKYGKDRHWVGRLFAKYGYKRKPPTETSRKYNLDEHFFDVINTEEKAYWLGFLYADGCVSYDRNNITLTLARKDKSHLITFKKALNSQSNIYDCTRINKEYGVCEASTITVSSIIMKEALIRNGCIPRKTFTCTFPNYNIVPRELMRHFIRGVFDGDGCLNISKTNKITFSVAGNYSIVNGIANELITSSVIEDNPHIYEHGKIFEVEIFGKYNIMKIMNYFYNESNVYLQRKYDKFKSVVNLDVIGDYNKKYIHDKKCFICGDINSIRYMIWHGNGEYNGKILCNKHYTQLYKHNTIFDNKPYTNPQIICLNNLKVFDSKKEAIEWCGLTSSFGIKKCIEGTQITSGKDPQTGELLRWAEYDEKTLDDKIQENNTYTEKYSRIRERPIYQIDINTKEILNRFCSSCEAGRFLNKKNFSNITSVCKGRRPSAFGYFWTYCDEYDKII